METGHDKVQGTDYAYTLHGWIKGVNSNSLREDLDIGQDGIKLTSPSHVNSYHAQDVYGYSLTYYDSNGGVKDYRAINNVSGSGYDFIANVYSLGLPQTPDLYNGNIRQMASSYLDGSAPGKSYGLKALFETVEFRLNPLSRMCPVVADVPSVTIQEEKNARLVSQALPLSLSHGSSPLPYAQSDCSELTKNKNTKLLSLAFYLLY